MTVANMIALPREWAWDFLLYAQRNPKPCPVLDVIEAGDHRTLLAEGPMSHGYSAVPRLARRPAGGGGE